MRPAALLLCALVAGCSSARVDVNAGTTTNTTAGSVHVRASDGLARVIVIMALIGAAVEYNRDEHPFPDARALLPGNTTPVPPLAPQRQVVEQDCSKAVDWSAGNLRCK